jgi:hypothetical protein
MDAVPELAHHVAEWYLPELTEQSVEDILAKLDVAATIVTKEGTPVRLLVALAVPPNEVLYAVVGAVSRDRHDNVSAARRPTSRTHRRCGHPLNRRTSCRGPAWLII